MGVGVLGPQQLAANSQIAGFDKELRMISALDDIYEDSSGIYVLESKTIPNAIRMKVDAKAKAESNNITITLLMRLQGLGVYDPTVAIGNEVRPQTRTVTIYRNIVRKVVTTPGYGNEALDARPYNLYGKWVDQLGVWNKEHHGLSIRQTILEQYGESLIYGRTLALCTRNWNPNFLIAGLSRRTMQMTYNTTTATFTTAIVNGILASGGGALTPLVTQTLNVPNLSNAHNLAVENRIEPLTIDGLPGGKGWILTMSELQATYLGDPTWSARNLGSLYTSYERLNDKLLTWRGVMGTYKNFLLCQDMMQPTLIVTGTAAPWGLTAGYVYPGDDDERQRDEVNTRDTVFILGKAAIIDWNAMPLRFIRQDDDYEMVLGRGTAVVEGLQQPIYDQQNPVNGSHEQFGSIVMVCSLPTYV